MEYVLLLAIVVSYASLSSKIKRISRSNNKKLNSKELKEFLNKKVAIVLDNEFSSNVSGILRSYDNKWIELETIKEKRNKTRKENTFYKINNIYSITIDNRK